MTPSRGTVNPFQPKGLILLATRRDRAASSGIRNCIGLSRWPRGRPNGRRRSPKQRGGNFCGRAVGRQGGGREDGSGVGREWCVVGRGEEFATGGIWGGRTRICLIFSQCSGVKWFDLFDFTKPDHVILSCRWIRHSRFIPNMRCLMTKFPLIRK